MNCHEWVKFRLPSDFYYCIKIDFPDANRQQTRGCRAPIKSINTRNVNKTRWANDNVNGRGFTDKKKGLINQEIN